MTLNGWMSGRRALVVWLAWLAAAYTAAEATQPI